MARETSADGEPGVTPQSVSMRGYVKVGFTSARKVERFCEVRGCTLVAFKSDKKCELDREATVLSARAGTKATDVVVEVRRDEKNAEWVLVVPKEQHAMWLNALRSADDTRFERNYKLGLAIGEGAFATVHMCYSLKSNELAAVKLIAKAKADTDKLKTIRREVSTHRGASNSEGVVRLIDVFEDDRMLYVVLEYMMKDLFDMQTAVGTFSEGQTRSIMRDLLKGLRHCHSRNVVHRDVKPENLFCTRETWPARVKLADFGLSRFWVPEKGEVMTSFVGTNEYVAPEVSLEQPYGSACDLWSAGVVMFELITGRRPFAGDSEQDLLRAVRNGSYSMSSSKWSHVSDAGKSVLKSLLCLDQNRRITAQAALCHPWFDKDIEGDSGGSCSFGSVDPNSTGSTALTHRGKKLFRIVAFAACFAGRLNALFLAKVALQSPVSSPTRRSMRKGHDGSASGGNNDCSEFLFSPAKQSPRRNSPASSGLLSSPRGSDNSFGLFGRRASQGGQPSASRAGRFMRKMTDTIGESENGITPDHSSRHVSKPITEDSNRASRNTSTRGPSQTGFPPPRPDSSSTAVYREAPSPAFISGGVTSGPSSKRESGLLLRFVGSMRSSDDSTKPRKMPFGQRQKSARRPIKRFPSLVNLDQSAKDTTA